MSLKSFLFTWLVCLMCFAAGASWVSLSPWQHPLSPHTAPTQSPLVQCGISAVKKSNLLIMCTIFFKHPTYYQWGLWVLCGCCVGDEWALSGYCCVYGRRHSAHFLWSCRASRFNSSGAGHGMSSHGRRGRAALWASIAPGHLYRTWNM